MSDLRSRTRRRLAALVAFSGLGLLALVRDDAFPAALASVTGRDGNVRNYTATIAVTKLPSDPAQLGRMTAGVDTALCR